MDAPICASPSFRQSPAPDHCKNAACPTPGNRFLAMHKLGNPNSTTQVAEPASIPRRSIVLKLTLFVGILVALTAGTLITVGYLYTSQMLSDQIDARLSAAADDRQGLLRSRLAHLDERVRLIAN